MRQGGEVGGSVGGREGEMKTRHKSKSEIRNNERFHFICINNFDLFFFFNDTATTEIYTLSLHDALPISAE